VTTENSTALDPLPQPGDPAGNGPGADSADALLASERRFASEFGPAPFGLAVISLAAGPAGGYLAANDTYCQLTGYSRAELTGAGFLGDVHPDEQPAVEAMVQEVASGGTGQLRADTRLVRKDGEIVSVRLTGSAIRPQAGDRYLTIFVEDRTAAEAARAEVIQLRRELVHAGRRESLGQLAGGIAHDFSNLLAVIGNYASLVRDEVSAAEADQSATRWEPVRRDVEQIEAATGRATRLIKHLLAFARREESSAVLIDVGQFTGDVIQLIGRLLGEQVSLVYQPRPGLWPVQVDPGQLEQALVNIAVNARDAMPSGGQLTIDTANLATAAGAASAGTGSAAGGAGSAGAGAGLGAIVIPASTELVAGLAADRGNAAGLADLPPGRYVRLSVSDTGSGMDAATAARAFEPFFTTKGGDQAAGLGLAAVRRFAARAGGRAWLRSEPGSGTTVTVLLPAVAGAASGAASGAAGPAAGLPGTEAGSAGSVLVVDDEPAIREVAHRVLSQAGYRVVTAVSQAEALGLLRDPGAPVDLLLADVVMPGLSGGAFAADAKSARPGLPILFMSGYEQPGDLAGGSPGAATQVLGKPFSRAALLARVSELLPASARPGAAS
jgi:PAS domain S-box-containing protein